MLHPDAQRYAEEIQEDLKALIRALCVIPSPSHKEDARVRFLCDFLEKHQITPTVDKAKNVIWSRHHRSVSQEWVGHFRRTSGRPSLWQCGRDKRGGAGRKSRRLRSRDHRRRATL